MTDEKSKVTEDALFIEELFKAEYEKIKKRIRDGEFETEDLLVCALVEMSGMFENISERLGVD